MACVHLLEVDGAAVDEVPNPCGALDRRLALPALVRRPAACDRAEIALERVARRGLGQRCAREGVPRLRHGVADRRDEIAPPLLCVGGGEPDLVLDLPRRARDELPLLGGHRHGRSATRESSPSSIHSRQGWSRAAAEVDTVIIQYAIL